MHAAIPNTFKKLVVTKLSPIFKEAVDIVHQNLVKPRSKEVLIKNRYVGINASDVNVTAGQYFHEKNKFPYDIGFEGIGEIVDIGDGVCDLKYGDPVMHLKFGAFSEYMYISADEVIPVGSLNPQLMPLLVGGTTASLSLDKCGKIVPGEKVLITAAAGGAGHIAVQWAKNIGCHVIGTCSSAEKVKFLESIGCDRPINYKKESLEKIFKEEYSEGLDVIWETVGGSIFDVLLQHLAIKGRLIIVGATSSYLTKNLNHIIRKDLLIKLLTQSSTLSGFFLPHYASDIPHYMSLLVRQHHEQNLKTIIDDGSSHGKRFEGLEDVARAVEFLHSGKNTGKVIVTL